MKLWDQLARRRRADAEETLRSPLAGKVIPLTSLRDETFSTGILGDGVGIIPTAGVLCAPADGRVEQTFETGHAITLVTDLGAELLLHIGMDTVELGGRHFEMLVKEGDRVAAGQELIRFDGRAIAGEGYELATPMVVTNADEYEIRVLARGKIAVGETLLQVTRREKK